MVPRSHPLPALALCSLLGCGAAGGDSGAGPCGAGFGRADNGYCYLLADTAGDADTDADSDADSDADADTDVDTGPAVAPITVSGTLTYAAALGDTPSCAIEAFDAAYVNDDGSVDHTGTTLVQQLVTCPAGDGAGAAYAVTFSPGSSTSIAIYGFVDADGSPTSPDPEVAYPENPLAVAPGGAYTGIDITIDG